ncbi:hypothetical protein GOP47_0029751 [Adiantum capillus-veneris]|nr:hypothetical protein GOP47_0029751 [Adiantum capillus-veneris]
MAVEQAAPAAFQQAAGIARARFYVELKAGETTFVSWKKLIKDFHRAAPPGVAEPPVGAHPALQARIAPEVVAEEDPLPPPPNRFNSVIEKIERIYKGNDSSDENDALNDCPDDDQYDTEDSFIDDRELNEYFSVDKAKLKHEGFFVNRGRLEWEVENAASVEVAPKKRKRRDVKKLSLEAGEIKRVKAAVHSEDAARTNSTPIVGLTDSSDMQLVISTSNKQTSQRKKKEAQDTLPKQDKKGTKERAISDHDTTNDKTEHRHSGVVAERSHAHVSPVNTGEIQLFNTSDWEDFKGQRAASTSSLSKVKSAQKVNSLESSREASGPTGVLKRAHTKSSPSIGKEISPVRRKGAAWERAFQELEGAVGQVCPQSLITQEPEQGKRNRLPPDVKLKLAKVARLVAKQGQLTDELIDRLMGILGHVVHVKTLKRNMKEMIETGLSALQEKEGRVQDIKREVTEMVKLRVHSLQAQDLEDREPLSDDFQHLGGSSEKLEGRYRWDHATEDKICDLYEQYIEGLEENRGPQIRKLYGELAELWPDGWMDNNGIKHAVQRAKERKKKQMKASIVKSESKKRPRSSTKQLDSEGARFPLLDLNLPGMELSSFGKSKGNVALQPELNSTFGSPRLLFDASRTDHLASEVPGKGFERKKSKMDVNVVMKKKVKRKLEKGPVVLASHAKPMTLEYPLVQPLVALPARPMEQHHFPQQSKEWATEHMN